MEENFLLILMTEFQATLFEKFSTFACVDSTHKTNEYGYKLISMVVADDFITVSTVSTLYHNTAFPQSTIVYT